MIKCIAGVTCITSPLNTSSPHNITTLPHHAGSGPDSSTLVDHGKGRWSQGAFFFFFFINLQPLKQFFFLINLQSLNK